MRHALSAPHDDSHAMVMDGHLPVVDLQARNIDRRPHLDPVHPARLPGQEPVRVAADATASDFDCRRAERLRLRPGGQKVVLTGPAATAQQAPAARGQFQPVDVQARNTADAPAQEHRGRHGPIPIDGESDMADPAAQSCDLSGSGTIEQADALLQRCIRHAQTLLSAATPGQVPLVIPLHPGASNARWTTR